MHNIAIASGAFVMGTSALVSSVLAMVWYGNEFAFALKCLIVFCAVLFGLAFGGLVPSVRKFCFAVLIRYANTASDPRLEDHEYGMTYLD